MPRSACKNRSNAKRSSKKRSNKKKKSPKKIRSSPRSSPRRNIKTVKCVISSIWKKSPSTFSPKNKVIVKPTQSVYPF